MMRSRTRAAPTTTAAALVLIVLLSGCFSERQDTAAPTDCDANVEVTIEGFAFAPANICVRAGGTVTWVNREPTGTAAHTTTSDTGVWGSELLEPGDSYQRRFDDKGTFPYHCTPHPFMQAIITVE